MRISILIFTLLLLGSCGKSQPEFFYVSGQIICETLSNENGYLELRECFSMSGQSPNLSVINPTNIIKVPNIEVQWKPT